MKKQLIGLILSFCVGTALAQHLPEVYVKTDVQLGAGDVAPFWFVTNQHGLASISPNSAYLRAGIEKKWDLEKRFDYAYGADLIGGYNLDANVIIQQLYVDLKYRSIFLSIGSKERTGLFRNALLSTGGTLWSGNARPIPQIRAGFYDWVRPFRADWFTLKGDISYGWFTDQRWQRDFINKLNGSYVKGIAYHHKYIAFQFGNDDTRFKVEAAYEIDQQFAGKKVYYKEGVIDRIDQIPSGIKDYIRAFFPVSGSSDDLVTNQAYYQGNYVGEWQVNVHYKLDEQHRFRVGFEKFWEDASGMSFQNRMDGLWSLEYNRTEPSIISGALVEYFQSTDQAGPCYWLPSYDGQETNIQFGANGSDSYYLHGVYNSWSHWGQHIGNALIPSPIYNTNGSLQTPSSRIKAWNLGVNGQITSEWQHRILLTHMRGWGNHGEPFTEVKKNLSGLIEVTYLPNWLTGAEAKLGTAFNTGELYGGKSWGVKLSLGYHF